MKIKCVFIMLMSNGIKRAKPLKMKIAKCCNYCNSLWDMALTLALNQMDIFICTFELLKTLNEYVDKQNCRKKI
jgi:hypothetical protein